MLIDKRLVQVTAGLAGIGALAFLALHLFLIAGYLGLVAILLAAFTRGWQRRYEAVRDTPPPGWQPTGEVYQDPGGGPVAVWHQGVRRIYVRAAAPTAEATRSRAEAGDGPAPEDRRS
ncbi:MAG: hypothetical protein K6U14_11320 [Firmicutes bacterium]|nr:hypothetical protein [Alicyclobacillaceae bacterium]MCL6498203.1 hypothetical protein [Bacillota bacterium]